MGRLRIGAARFARRSSEGTSARIPRAPQPNAAPPAKLTDPCHVSADVETKLASEPRPGSPRRRNGRGGRATGAALFLLAAAAALAADTPPLPSSLFGTLSVDGAPAPEATEVSAWLAGAPAATTTARLEEGEARFRIDVPGDRAETAEREGAVEGELFELRVGAATVATILWRSGSYQRVDLATAAGPDLAVELSDGVDEVRAGETLDYNLTIRNEGPGHSRDVTATVLVAEGLAVVAASDGGSAISGGVQWPAFDLAAEAATTRTVSVRVGEAFPSGVEALDVRSNVADDGSGGLDPDLADNTAVDSDALDAWPELALGLTDDRDGVAPGETLVYRAAVVNRGGQEATGAALVVRVPALCEIYSASHGGVHENGVVSWPLFAVPAGQRVERALTVRVPIDLEPQTTTLEIAGEVFDDGANGDETDLADNRAVDLDTVEHAPDLKVARVDVASTFTDPQTLAISGEVELELENLGTLPAGAFSVVLFADADLDGAYLAGVDVVLAETTVGGLAARQVDLVRTSVRGAVRFLGESVFAMVDSGREIEELDEENNVGDSARGCDALPSGELSAVVERRWPLAGGAGQFARAIDSLSTPLVVQLTDDNGDGLWDERDVADLVFVTTDLVYTLEPMVALRAVRGDTLEPIFDVDGLFPQPIAPVSLSFSGLAAADIDRDGKPEIVSTTFIGANKLIAFEHTGTVKWQSGSYRTHPVAGRLSRSDNPTIADLDGDGETEIVVGANVFDRFGRMLWRGSGGQAFQSAGNRDDHRSGAISAVADVDLDGALEVVTGNTLYRADGSIVWQVALPDGFPAVGNFDADPQPEIVVVARGTVRLHDADGELLWGPLALPGSDPEAGGAPTVGDFDGDSRPEIGVAGSDVFVVYETDGAVRWQASTQDRTSNFTGSTLFDFDGDGAMEVVYRDELRLWIFRGTDGAVLAQFPISSDTWTEEPVVADVDGDGSAEIVVSSDRALDVAVPSGGRTAGLFVVGDAGGGWVAARAAWNQHAYAPELVEDDGGVPSRPEWGWLAHNSFRANVPPPGGAFGAADLTASRLSFDLANLPLARISVRIGNGGRGPAAAGLPVAVYLGDPAAGGTLLGTSATDRPLLPGEFVDLDVELALPIAGSAEVFVVADDDGTGNGREQECDESNNVVSAIADLASRGLWLTLDDGTDGVGAGDLLTYRITVRNAFPNAATGVSLVDELPSELEFVAASDGGAETAGRVVWPGFALPSGAIAERSVTVLVAAALPAGVTSITNRATVGDDGAAGPEPSPADNTAVDVDAVRTATADAGGPYAGVEGSPVLFDGSASFDRDGTLVAFEWDLDDDGEFDDASGPSASRVFADEGLYRVRLRVRDDAGELDVDAAEVTIANVAPTLSAPPSLAGEEGAPLSLASVGVADPGADALVATVVWGDGTIETVPVSAAGLSALHTYVDDGEPAIGVCVADGDGGESCATIAATIANVAPEIEESSGFDLLGWSGEEPPGATTVLWQVAADGATAVETKNGRPTVLVGDLPAYGVHEFTIRVATAIDDDYVGFALGVEPGDLASSAAKFLLVDWKGGDQSGARAGLALSRVVGVPTDGEYWLHDDSDANGSQNGVTELARGATLGARSWRRHTDHRFRVDYRASRLRVWVDGALELDVAGAFPPGRLGFYDNSQSNAVFTPVASTLAVAGAEGEPAALRARFADPGLADTHEASIDWGDGASEALAVAAEEGRGEISAAHAFRDDGAPRVALCVEDDDAGVGCAEVPAFIENRPPAVTFDLVASGFREDAVHLGASSFVDPGVDDLHTATVDWGDGTIEPVAVVESGGSGTLAASHLFAAPGIYEIELCVDDGDGGTTCATRTLALVDRFLDLALGKTVSPLEARPGALVTYTLTAENRGSLPATGVVLSDSLPQELTVVSASGGGTLAGDTVSWAIASLAPGASVAVTLTAQVGTAAPFGAVVVNSASVVDDGASGPDSRPADNVASAPFRLSDGVTPIVSLTEALAGTEGSAVSLAGASYADTTTGEAHTATILWGDGASSVATLAPAAGTAGTIGAAHTYADDGVYPIEVCVRDAAANVGCATTVATIANGSPAVLEPGPIDFRSWRSETYPGPNPAFWSVAADGLSVTQTQNSDPTLFYSPASAAGVIAEGLAGVFTSSDDDFFGLALGFSPGESTDPAAEYLLLDWKQADQSHPAGECGSFNGLRGIALSRVVGIPSTAELWWHRNAACNGEENGVVELARARTLGRTGWVDRREYALKVQYEPDRVQVWVNGVLEIDLAGSFPAGPMAFYNHSQAVTRFRGFVAGLASQLEGETFELSAGFTDAGTLDTHQATIDWDDGTVEAAPGTAVGGAGAVAATHDYLEDGDYAIEVCVTDDDGGADCGRFPLLVANVAPTVVPAPESSASAGERTAFDLATFTDPGRLDSHTATVDWGDGVTEVATVAEDDGAGEVAAAHAYAAPGLYTVTVCVVDDDGGEGCGATPVAVGSALPRLAAAKTVAAVDRDGDGRTGPGDDLVYAIEIANLGPTSTTGIVLTDPIPAHTTLHAGTVTPEARVTGLDPLTVELPSLAPGDSLTVGFAVRIDAVLPLGVTEISNQGGVTSTELAPVATDDPALPGASDPTRIAVHAESRFTFAKRAELVDLDGNGAATAGDEIAWTLALTNVGATEGAGLLVRDRVPNDSELVSGSIVSDGLVTREDPVEIVFDQLPAGATESVELRTRIVDPLPRATIEIVNQAELWVGELAEQLSDDPAEPGTADPTRLAVAPIPDLTIEPAAVAEGNVGTTPLRFRLTLDVATAFPVSVAWATADQTALAGEDYVAASGVATFAPGTTEAFVDVAVLGDLVVETDDTLRLSLAEPSHLRPLALEALGTIVNDDRAGFGVSDAAAEEGEPLGFLVRLSAPSALGAAVDVSTADATATAGEDYLATAGRLVFAPFETEKSVAVATVEDTTYEGDETLRLVLSNPAVGELVEPESTGTIRDDDAALLAIDDVELDEGDEGATPMRFTVSLAAPLGFDVTVDYATVAETATETRDFEPVAGSLTIPAGELTGTIDVTAVGDPYSEPDETLRVELANPVAAILDDPIGVGTIRDDDLCRGPNLLANGGAELKSWTELFPGWTSPDGSSWQRRTADPAPLAGAASFDAADLGSAELAQSIDLSPFAGRIDAGGLELAVSGWVRTGDESPADTARVVVELFDTTGAVLLDLWDSGPLATAGEWTPFERVLGLPFAARRLRLRLLAERQSGAELDAGFDELAVEPLGLPTLSVGDATVHEDLAPLDALFEVRLSCRLEEPVSIGYATADGSATSPDDYLATSGAATIAAGELASPLPVPVVDDALAETAERFTLDLVAVDGADPLDPRGEGTILDGDHCQESHGYWKNHPEQWPTRSLVVGNVLYGADGILFLLGNDLTDPSTRLAQQLTATLMNLLSGTHPWILPRVDEAQEFLALHPLGSDVKGEALDTADELEYVLKNYNKKCTGNVPK